MAEGWLRVGDFREHVTLNRTPRITDVASAQLRSDWEARFRRSRPYLEMLGEMADFYHYDAVQAHRKYMELVTQYRLEEHTNATLSQLRPVFPELMEIILRRLIRDYYRTEMFEKWQMSVLKRIV
jgi:hypothetical protein